MALLKDVGYQGEGAPDEEEEEEEEGGDGDDDGAQHDASAATPPGRGRGAGLAGACDRPLIDIDELPPPGAHPFGANNAGGAPSPLLDGERPPPPRVATRSPSPPPRPPPHAAAAAATDSPRSPAGGGGGWRGPGGGPVLPATPPTAVKNCSMCMEKPVDCVFLDCGHGCTCEACANLLVAKQAHCPLCRSDIKRVLRVYL